MKKLIGALCCLTILSSCGTSHKDHMDMTNAERHQPALNDGSSGNLLSPLPPSGVRSGMAAMSSTPPEPPEFALNNSKVNGAPPLGATHDAASTDYLNGAAVASAPLSSSEVPAVPPADRRSPELNGTASNDLVAPPRPTTPVAQASNMPLPPVPPAPPAFAAQQNKDEYPRLAAIPPSPPVPQSVDADPRVQQMKQDLASMDPQTPPSGPKVIVKSISSGSVASPQVITQLPNSNAQTSLPPVPGTAVIPQRPIFQPNAQPQYLGQAALPPTPPAPPAFQNQPAPLMAPQPQPPQFSAPAQAPAPQFAQSQPALMPQGPTIVVHADGASEQRRAPSGFAPAPVPPAPPQFTSAPLAPPAPPAFAPQPQFAHAQTLPTPVASPAPGYAPPAGNLVTPAPMPPEQQQASTDLSQLHPISMASSDPVNGGVSYPAASSGGQQVSEGAYRALPDSRYAKLRAASRNAVQY